MRIPKAFVNKSAVFSQNADSVRRVRTVVPTDPLINPSTPATSEEVSRIDTSWLPFAAKSYKISPRLEDYVIQNQMICPSDLANRNGVGFPKEELVAFLPPPMNRQVFKSWVGCPVHEEHENEDCTKAVGVIFDTTFRKIKNFGDGNHWAVYGLIGVDKLKFPELAEKVRLGQINTGSMGCTADSFRCSVCNHEAHENPMLNCSHITSTKDVNWRYVNHEGKQKLAFLNAYGLSPIEYSIVREPAWATCLSDNILT